jgi:membrane protease YdiL (CAAX protease family)
VKEPSPTAPTPWLFLALTIGATWLCWVPAALLPAAGPAFPTTLLHYLGGVMPLVVTLALLYTRHTREERLDYWRRVADVKRLSARWYAITLLTAPALTLLAALADIILGGGGGVPEALLRFLPHPLGILPFAVFMLLFGPLPEELAWRGYGLDRLQARLTPLASSLVLGAAWAVWHLPLFFINGTYQHGLGLGTRSFWLYQLDKVPQSVLMTWIYNNTWRSTLSAVLFHFTVNFVGELFQLASQAEVFYIVLWYVAAGLVAVLWQARKEG